MYKTLLLLGLVAAAADLHSVHASDIQRPVVGVHDGRPALPPMKPIDADVTVTTTVNGQDKVLPGHYYRSSNGKIREDRGNLSVITDTAGGTITVLNRDRKEKQVRLITRPLRPTDSAKGDDSSSPGKGFAVSQPVQLDKLEGHAVQKVIITPPQSAKTAIQQVEVWTATDIGLQVYLQTKGSDHSTTKAFSSIKVIEPDPAIFSIPNDYTLVAAKSTSKIDQ